MQNTHLHNQLQNTPHTVNRMIILRKMMHVSTDHILTIRRKMIYVNATQDAVWYR